MQGLPPAPEGPDCAGAEGPLHCSFQGDLLLLYFSCICPPLISAFQQSITQAVKVLSVFSQQGSAHADMTSYTYILYIHCMYQYDCMHMPHCVI